MATLLGPLAWLLQTRIDVAVYVAMLQRHCKAPKAEHLRKMNRLLRYIHRNPQGLTYEQLPVLCRLILVGDSAFQAPATEAEATDPLAMCSYIIDLVHERPGAGGGRNAHQGGKFKLHMLEWKCGKRKHVCRGVWSSKLHNQRDMVEYGTIISAFLEEVFSGPGSAEELRRKLETGNVKVPVHAYTDSYSLYSDLTSQHLKFPTEKATYFHLAYLQERLTCGWLKTYSWIAGTCASTALLKGHLTEQRYIY